MASKFPMKEHPKPPVKPLTENYCHRHGKITEKCNFECGGCLIVNEGTYRILAQQTFDAFKEILNGDK